MDEQPPADQPTEPSLPPRPDAFAPPATAEPAAPRRRRGRILIAGIVAFALLLGGGAAAAFLKMRGSGEQLFSKVPASSDVVFTVYLNPAAGQKANLFLLASRFPALGSEQQLTSRLGDALDQALAAAGLRHTDFAWVGDQVAFVLDVPSSIGVDATPSYALLIDVKNEDDAKAGLQKIRDTVPEDPAAGPWVDATVDGVDVTSNHSEAYAVFDGSAVVASSLDEMSSIVSTAHGDQPALEGSSQLQAATAGLPEGKLALLYVNPKDLLGLLNQMPGFDASATSSNLSTLNAITGLAMTLSVQPDGVALDEQEVYDPTKLTPEQKTQMDQASHPDPLLTAIPSDAFALISAEHLDTSLNSLADQMERTSPPAAKMLRKLGITGDAGLLSTLNGDMAIEASPGSSGADPGAAIVLGTDDPVAMQHAFAQLAKGLSSLSESDYLGGSTSPAVFGSSSKWISRDYQGVQISSFQKQGVPDISYAVVDGKGVIGTSASQVERIIDTAQGGQNISSSTAYKGAIASVPSSSSVVWVNIQGLVEFARGVMPSDARAAFDRDTLPNLAPLKAFVVGSEGNSSRTHTRFFLQIG